MRNLLEFLSRNNHWIVFLLLEVVSAILLFSFNSYQGSVWFSSANAVAGKIYEWDSKMTSFFALAKVNEALTQRNIALEQQVNALEEQLADAAHDSMAAHEPVKAALKGYRFVPAKVISNTVNLRDNLFTIDKGYADGVRKDMGVVSGNGVAGIVYMTSAHYAVVISVLNSSTNISCKISGRGYFGYLHWNGGYTHMAYVDDIPRHARFRVGDSIVTSGFSSVFPPGVMVGRIRYIFNSADGLSYRVKIDLATDFGRLRDVSVVDNTLMQERVNILRAARDTLSMDRQNQ